MSANGLMYTAKVQSVSVTNVAQNLWEIITGAASILVHSIRIEFVPVILSGVAQDARGAIAIQTITTTGTGGSAVVPQPQQPRNTVAALTTFNALVTSPGTLGVVKSASNPTAIAPFERLFTSDQRIPIASGGATGGRLAINLAAGLGGTFVMSSEICFEEF